LYRYSAATAMRFLKIAGPVFFLNSIKVFFVASLVQAVTAISPECSAANGGELYKSIPVVDP
jgi:hypothetical protein